MKSKYSKAIHLISGKPQRRNGTLVNIGEVESWNMWPFIACPNIIDSLLNSISCYSSCRCKVSSRDTLNVATRFAIIFSRRSRVQSNSGVLFLGPCTSLQMLGVVKWPHWHLARQGATFSCHHLNTPISTRPGIPVLSPHSFCIATHPAVSHDQLFEASERWARGKGTDFHWLPEGPSSNTQ